METAESASISSTALQMDTPESDSDSRNSRNFKPASTSASTLSTSSHGFHSVVTESEDDPDIPLPSVEGDSRDSLPFSTPDSSSSQFRTPSISITPHPSEEAATPSPCVRSTRSVSFTLRQQSNSSPTINGIDEQIGNLALSSQSRSATPDRNVLGTLARPESSEESIRESPRHGSDHPVHSRTISLGTSESTQSIATGNIVDGFGNLTLGPEAPSRGATPRSFLHPEVPSTDSNNRSSTSPSRSGRRRRSSSYLNQTPHKVEDEEPPHERFHEPGFQQAFGNAKRLMRDLMGVLASATLHTEPESAIQRLYLEANYLSFFQHAATRTVGFVGDSGVGKSSLINSLLDFSGLARTSNNGACTCAATEFHYHDRDDFAIEVEYFAIEDIQDHFIDLLKSYRMFHFHGEQMENYERKDFEKKANLAQDTFQAAFRNRLGQNEQFLLDPSEQTVLETLRRWTRESIRMLVGRAEGVEGRDILADAQQCSNRLLELTSEPTSIIEPSVWPFIRKIRVFLKSHILSRGLVLVDLPGLRDVNSARSKITEEYALRCDEIFAVCPIGRAKTDASVMGVLGLARNAEKLNVGIVCTKSDDIRAHEAETDWRGQVSATTIRSHVNNIADDQREIEKIDADLEEFDGISEDAMTDEDREERAELEKDRRKTQKLKDRHEFELKSFLINTRNQEITRILEETYHNVIPRGQLNVFCVSNADYWEHRLMPKEAALPFLRLSGILDMRRHCISILANSQLRAATEYMKVRIPALLNDVQLWVQSGAGGIDAERRRAIQHNLDEVERELHQLTGPPSRINTIARSMKQQFKEQIFQIMIRSSAQWTNDARDASSQWQGWHSSTYSAFCRNYGDYSTKTVGPHCWNDEAMATMVRFMATRWQTFRQNLLGSEEDYTDLIESTFDRAASLCNPVHIPADLIRTLTATLVHRQYLLLSEIEQIYEESGDSLLTLRRDALSGLRTSITGTLMEESYTACNLISGPGSDSKRKAIIRERFKNEELFISLGRQFRNRFSRVADDLEREIKRAISSHLEIIRMDLDTLRIENAALEGERYPQFRGRVDAEVQRVRSEMGNVYRLVDGIREVERDIQSGV